MKLWSLLATGSKLLRMKRRDPVTDGELRLLAILYEPALRYLVGGPEVMREQYEEIVTASALDNVTLQVLPATLRGYLSPHDFTLLDLGPALPGAVQLDTAWGAVSVTDKPKEVGKFGRKFDALARCAMAPEDTVPFLHALAREIST